MNTNHKLLETLHKLGSEGKAVERLYARMLDENLFLAAYANLYSNDGAMTTGVDPEDKIDGMSLSRIQEIIQTLEHNDWKWQPVRRKHIPKANGKMRPLGIPGWSDKLVQEVVRMVLEAYYEPRFHDESHGFRQHRSCHTALLQIKKTWTGVVWFVEGDIKGCFDNIDHNLLLQIVGQRVRDFRFLKLLRTMLKAGYWEDGQQRQTLSGTPQGGIVSPLLANIFLHELDEYVLKVLKPAFDKGTRRRINKEYEKLNNQLHQARRQGNIPEAKRLERMRREVPRSDPTDPDFRRLYYVRYADDFLIGIIGSKAETDDIKAKIGSKLAELRLEMSQEKTVITNAAHESARFLGYDIYKAQDLTHRHVNGRVQLSVPEDRAAHLAKRYLSDGKPIHRNALIDADVPEIIHIFDMELRGYYNYYKLAYNVSTRLNKLKYSMWYSLMRTLARKMKSSVSKLMRRYKVIGPKTGKKCVGVEMKTDRGERLITFGDLRLVVDWNPYDKDVDPYHPALRQRELIFRLKHHECELCGHESDCLEVHHIRRLKDIRRKVREGKGQEWELVMAARNRKALVVCRECHLKIHGKSLKVR